MEPNSEFYSRTGYPVCFASDDKTIHFWDGKAAAYLEGSDNKVYAFSGKFLGWYANGWLYDRGNKPALFSASATSGPVKPLKKIASPHGRAQFTVKASQQLSHSAPARHTTTWSGFADVSYFTQEKQEGADNAEVKIAA